MRDADWAWVAGIIEGEGNLALRRSGRTASTRCQLQVQVKMCDLDVIEQLRERTGVGQIYGPRIGRKANHSPSWIWAVNRTDEVQLVLLRILPWLGKRRFERACFFLDYIALGSERLNGHARRGMT
jgi:hypothetical protein